MPPPLISVVMPVYNVATYLPRCLDSLAEQTRPIDEIIVVDDGSTDECPHILADYAAKLPQMRVIRQENSGLSAARNTGMQHATGIYLSFVDSDDFLAPQMTERMLALARADKLDVVLCNANYHFEGRRNDRPIYVNVPASKVLPGREWLKERLRDDRLMHMVWMHLYLRDFLMKYGFRFVPNLIHEDVIWTTEVLLAADRVRYDPTPLYYYRIPVRIFTPENNKKRLESVIRSSIYNAKQLLRLANESTADYELRNLLRWQAVDGAFSVFHKIDKIQSTDWKKSQYRAVQSSGLFPLLWRNAVGWNQRRRIAHQYIRCYLGRCARD